MYVTQIFNGTPVASNNSVRGSERKNGKSFLDILNSAADQINKTVTSGNPSSQAEQSTITDSTATSDNGTNINVAEDADVPVTTNLELAVTEESALITVVLPDISIVTSNEEEAQPDEDILSSVKSDKEDEQITLNSFLPYILPTQYTVVEPKPETETTTSETPQSAVSIMEPTNTASPDSPVIIPNNPFEATLSSENHYENSISDFSSELITRNENVPAFNALSGGIKQTSSENEFDIIPQIMEYENSSKENSFIKHLNALRGNAYAFMLNSNDSQSIVYSEPHVTPDMTVPDIETNTGKIFNISSYNGEVSVNEIADLKSLEPIKTDSATNINAASIQQAMTLPETTTADSVKEVVVPYADSIDTVSRFIEGLGQTDGTHKLKMKLLPEGLGEVSVDVAFKNGNVSVKIIADNPVIQKEIANGEFSLRKMLETHNLNLSGFDVNSRNEGQYQQQSQYQRDNWQNRRNPHRSSFNESNDSAPEISPQTQRLSYQYYNRTLYMQV